MCKPQICNFLILNENVFVLKTFQYNIYFCKKITKKSIAYKISHINKMLLFCNVYHYKTYTIDEALLKLQNYCAYQERCHQEVRQKLKEMRMIPNAIDIIIVHLLEHNFLNEERFAKTYVSGKFRIKKRGKYRLTSALKKKDISKHNINLAISQIPSNEYIEVFNVLAEKKANSIREKDTWKKKKKLVDYLLYRGWESHLVYDKVNELIK